MTFHALFTAGIVEETGSEPYLICGIDELHSFVGHREYDGRYFLHLFCGLLGVHEKHNNNKREKAAVTFRKLITALGM